MKLDYVVSQLVYFRLLNCREELICKAIHLVYCAYIENTIENVDRNFYFRFPRYQHFAWGLQSIAMQ